MSLPQNNFVTIGAISPEIRLFIINKNISIRTGYCSIVFLRLANDREHLYFTEDHSRVRGMGQRCVTIALSWFVGFHGWNDVVLFETKILFRIFKNV